MSMEDRLNAISVDSQSEKHVKVPPKADNLARLLTQGLQSHDRKIISVSLTASGTITQKMGFQFDH